MTAELAARARRSERIDTMRGIACLLLVLYHVIGNTPTSGLRVPAGHPVAEFNSVLLYLRMPLFAFLSGLVYAMRPFQGNLPAFLKGKFRRLIVPMLIVGTLFFVVQRHAPDVNAAPSPWHTMHIVPVAHFWFLEAMFWVFFAVALFDGRRWLSRPLGVAAAFALACLAHHVWPAVEILGISGALYLMPYFLTGLFVVRFGVSRPALALAAAALAAGLGYVLWVLLSDAAALPDRVSLPALAIGVAACLLMNASRLEVTWLARIGVYSFGIYMFHVFFTAGSRVLLSRMGVGSLAALIAAGLVAGVLGPMAVEALTRRLWPAGYRWVFGARAKPPSPPGRDALSDAA